MSFKLTTNIKNIEYVACSGGVDSMALLNFIKNSNPNIKCAFYHHGTPASTSAFKFLTGYCNSNNIKLVIGELKTTPKPGQSKEAFWRHHRYKFLNSLNGIVATAHHLDDVAETYLMSSLYGKIKLIKPKHGNIVRPLLRVRKKELINWCVSKNQPWVDDESNNDLNFSRNRVRKKLLPEALKIYPGFMTTIDKIQCEKWGFKH